MSCELIAFLIFMAFVVIAHKTGPGTSGPRMRMRVTIPPSRKRGESFETLNDDLKKLQKNAPRVGVEVSGLVLGPLVELVPADATEHCCECGEDYPQSDLVFHRHIYCPKCRQGGKV